MKRTTIIRTCLIAATAIVLNSVTATAQDEVAVVRISDRTQDTDVPPPGEAAEDSAEAAPAASADGCAEGCAEACSPACRARGGCDSCCRVPRRMRRMAQGCQTCPTGNNCQGAACNAAGCPNGAAACQANGCPTGYCMNGQWVGDPNMGYKRGYQKRMDRLCRQQGREMANAAHGGYWSRQTSAYVSRNARVSQRLFGWMTPSGSGGQGAAPFGHYNMVYAHSPNCSDPRDGGVYGAQGYGTHVTVPLAPHVRHAYNYGWGMPSSRITHISSVAPYTLPRPLHW